MATPLSSYQSNPCSALTSPASQTRRWWQRELWLLLSPGKSQGEWLSTMFQRFGGYSIWVPWIWSEYIPGPTGRRVEKRKTYSSIWTLLFFTPQPLQSSGAVIVTYTCVLVAGVPSHSRQLPVPFRWYPRQSSMESKLIGQFFFITDLVGTFPQLYLEPFYPQNLRTYRNVLSYSRWNSLGKPHRNPAPSRTFLQTTQKAELCVIGKLLRTSRTFPPKKKLTTLQLTTWFRWSNSTLTVLKPNSKLPKNHTSGRPSNHKIAAFRNSWS